MPPRRSWHGPCLAALVLLAAAPLAAQSVHREVLDNGLTLIIDDRALTHAVELRAVVAAGPAYEGDLLGTGVSAVVRRILSDAVRAGRIAADDPRQATDRLRSELDVGATSFSLTTTDRYVDAGVRLLVGVLGYRDYDAAAVVQARELTLQQSAAAAADPRRVERQALLGTALRRHPARLPITGLADRLGTLDLESVRRYHRRRYTAPNTTLIVVGNVDVDRVRAAVRTIAADLPATGWAMDPVASEPPQLADRHRVVVGPGDQERHVYAWRVSAPHQRDHVVVAVIAQLLADPRISDLARAFRTDQLAAELRVELDAEPDQPSFLRVSYEPYAERGAAAWLAVQQVFERLAAVGPGEDQIAAAKRLLLRQRIAGQAGVAAVAADIERWERLVGVPAYGEQFLDAVATVTAADVQRVAGSWLHPNGRNRNKLILLPAGSDPVASADPGADQGLTLADVPPQIEELPGALRLHYRRLPIGLVHVQITLAGGAASDRSEYAGETALLARLLAEGSEDLSGDALQQTLARHGMRLRSQADVHTTELTLTCFPEDVAKAMRILLAIVTRPALHAEDIARIKQMTIADLAMTSQDGPWNAVLARAVRQTLLGGHYATDPVYGTRDSLADIDLATLREHLAATVVGRRMVLSLYGEFDAAYAIGELRALLGEDPPIAPGEAWMPDGTPWPSTPPASVTTLTWERKASAVALAWPGPPLAALDEDGAAIDVVTALLAGDRGSAGRIGRALGEARVPVQDLAVSATSYHQRGLYAVRALMSEGRREAATAALRAAVARLVEDLAAGDDAVTDAELALAKANCVVGRVLAREDQVQALRTHARSLLLRGGIEQDLAYEKRVLAIDRADLLRVMRRYLAESPAEVRLVSAAADPPPASEADDAPPAEPDDSEPEEAP